MIGSIRSDAELMSTLQRMKLELFKLSPDWNAMKIWHTACKKYQTVVEIEKLQKQATEAMNEAERQRIGQEEESSKDEANQGESKPSIGAEEDTSKEASKEG